MRCAALTTAQCDTVKGGKYAAAYTPTSYAPGGKGGTAGPKAGGQGGGIVQVFAYKSLKIDGKITANGLSGQVRVGKSRRRSFDRGAV